MFRVARFFITISFITMFLVTPSSYASYSKNDEPHYSEDEFRKPQSSNVKTFASQQELIHYKRRLALRQANMNKYQKHINEISKGGFEDESENSYSPVAEYVPKKVLTSGSTAKQKVYRSRYYNRGSDLNTRSQLQKSDIEFLQGLSNGLKDKTVTSNINSILASQSDGNLLSESEYDFLTDLAGRLDHDQASLMLLKIAEKRRKSSYSI